MTEGADADASLALAKLANRWRLSQRQLDQLANILSVLESSERAPTTVREPVEAIDTHLADSLVALDLDAVRAAQTVADMGSGAGFPGLALAVALGECRVSLIESQDRKCAFLGRAISRAVIDNARIVCVRVEQWAEGTSANDVVTARALGSQPVVLEYAAPLLRLGGTLVDWRGKRDEQEERRAGVAAEELGLRLVAIERVQPFAAARARHLHLYEKVMDTPQRFPRRAGMARKRPLGG
ncbi:MAG TPA: 16S rRNA (guanine(527)-N(7))-methyltransferase RsmG [Solirubrobacteraceae bacterium]|nr:16S rRNA (guanine(527)-N(7))-methyltransferase RsmG [Solirubrobacteraceae bacterium]